MSHFTPAGDYTLRIRSFTFEVVGQPGFQPARISTQDMAQGHGLVSLPWATTQRWGLGGGDMAQGYSLEPWLAAQRPWPKSVASGPSSRPCAMAMAPVPTPLRFYPFSCFSSDFHPAELQGSPRRVAEACPSYFVQGGRIEQNRQKNDVSARPRNNPKHRH